MPDPQAPATFERSVLDWDEPRRPPHDGVLALYHDLLALRPRLGDEMRVAAPSDTTLLLERPPVHVAVTLEGPAQFDLSSSFDVVLHTEQGGYALYPRPPVVTDAHISFTRPGSAILQSS